jgi:hypothetical protein
MGAVEKLLERLDGVRRIGAARWSASCPAHDDRHPSLSVSELDDGRVLLHDHAGCEPRAVLRAIGLDFEDLFPERATNHHQPKLRRPIPIRDVVTALKHELTVGFIILSDVANAKPIADADRARAGNAQRRIARFLQEIEHAG